MRKFSGTANLADLANVLWKNQSGSVFHGVKIRSIRQIRVTRVPTLGKMPTTDEQDERK